MVLIPASPVPLYKTLFYHKPEMRLSNFQSNLKIPDFPLPFIVPPTERSCSTSAFHFLHHRQPSAVMESGCLTVRSEDKEIALCVDSFVAELAFHILWQRENID